MPQVITLGETMAMFSPCSNGPLRYVTDYRMHIAGAESNVAIGLCKLGHTAGWIGRLGADEFGQYVRNMIRAEGVDTSCVYFDAGRPTGLMFKETGADDESRVYYYRHDSAAGALCPDDIPPAYFAGAAILHLTGITPLLSANCLKAIRHAMRIAKERNMLVSFDPNIRLKLWRGADHSQLMRELARASDILFVGLEEARVLVGTTEPSEVFDRLWGLGLKRAALKDGSRGAWVGEPGLIRHIPSAKCVCIDPVGAGDAFAAAFLAGVLDGRDTEDCGRMGAIAGAMATCTTGDIEGYPSAEQMAQRLEHTGQVYR